MKGHRDRHCALIRQLLHNPVTAFPVELGYSHAPLIPTELRAEKTRSLPNRDLDLGYKHLAMETTRDLGFISYFEEKRKSLDEISSSFFNRRPFTGNVQFWTETHESVIFALDHCR
jgi:hypothetical protein